MGVFASGPIVFRSAMSRGCDRAENPMDPGCRHTGLRRGDVPVLPQIIRQTLRGGGRPAQDSSARIRNMAGAINVPAAWCIATCEAAAPTILITTPAYAHSFN